MNQIIIDRMVKQNNVIQDEQLRKMMHETFDNIFKYLGKQNFLRWINMRNLAPRIKNLAIEEFTKEDKEKYPNWAGFYTIGTDRIKLKRMDDLPSNTHETYHFMVKKCFPTFIDEGLTEYLKKNTLETTKGSYGINVNVVGFLHNILGDSIIKAYLTGNTDKGFNNYFSSYVTKDSIADTKVLQDFYDKLDIIHEYLFSNKENNRSDKTIDITYEKIYEYLQNTASNYIRKKAQNLEYYKSGKLDFNAINADLHKVKKLLKPCFSRDDYLRLNIENNINKSVLASIIENSPLSLKCNNREELVSSVLNQIYNKDGNINIDTANELFNSTQSVTMDLAKLKLENNANISKDGKFNIIEFIRQVGNIQAATNMSQIELDTILGNYILQNCPAGIDVKRIESIIKDNITLIRNLDDIKFDREKNTVESTYFKIDYNRYIEKRDGQQFMVTVGPNGEISDKPYNIDINRIYSLTPLGKNPRKPQNIGDIDALKMDLIIDRLYRSINPQEYKNILKDAPDPFSIKDIYYTQDVDMRSRAVDFPKYIADLKSILTILPYDKQDEFVNNSTTRLLLNIYGVSPKDNPDLYSQMQNDVKVALNAQEKKFLEKKVRDLDENANTLNDIRKTRVEENRKHTLIGFKTEEAKTIYKINQQAMKKKQLEADERDFIKNSDEYILDKENVDKHEYFPGLYILGAYNCNFKANVDINKMATGIKDFIQRYPEKERTSMAQSLSRRLLRKCYGRETTKPIQGIDDERSSIYDEMQNMILNQVSNQNDINLDDFHQLEQNMHHIIGKEYNYYHDRSVIGFADDQTKSAYEQYKNVQSRTDIPEDIKDGMLNQLKDLNKSRLESNSLLSKVINLTEGRCTTSKINNEIGKIRTMIQERDENRWHKVQ